MHRQSIAALVLSVALAGCAALLPKAHSEVSSPWHSFDEARLAIERIVPNETTAEGLRAMGIDPYTSPNVQLLSYSDILLRFPMNGSVQFGGLDRGLQECLEAGKACSGYFLSVREVKRDRTGAFWPDALGFKRVTDVSGWTFNALILMNGNRVVYTLYGGEPVMREQEVTRQPLGPVQNFGTSLSIDRAVR